MTGTSHMTVLGAGRLVDLVERTRHVALLPGGIKFEPNL